jgi:protein gp37
LLGFVLKYVGCPSTFLRQIQATVRFVSLEPLLSNIEMGEIDWLDWAIVGAESGQKARPMDEDWVRNIKNQCQEFGVPFFYKQRIANGKKISVPSLDGRIWDEYPLVASLN